MIGFGLGGRLTKVNGAVTRQYDGSKWRRLQKALYRLLVIPRTN